MTSPVTHVATRDTRSVLERALSYGIQHQILRDVDMARMQEEGAKALVQIANYFNTAYQREYLDTALVRFNNLASLYLDDRFGDDLHAAAISLRDNTLLSHSRGGSEMLKQLHAMPESTVLFRYTAESQRDFLDKQTIAKPMMAMDYRAQRACRIERQHLIACAFWLGELMGVKKKDLETSEQDQLSAESVIKSAILVCLAGDGERRLPSHTGLFKLLSAVRKPRFRPNKDVWQRIMRNAPPDYQLIGDAALADFETRLLLKLKSLEYKVGDFITGENSEFHIDEGSCEDIAEYEKAVSGEWYKVTRGRDEEDLLATVFLTIAAGMPPKRSLLLREGKTLIETLRREGFKTTAVEQFIESFAPHGMRDDLLRMWKEDLLPEAEVALADPLQDDTRMDRALAYLRENCRVGRKPSDR